MKLKGQQRGEGMFGALIVRSNEELQSLLYDHDEHVVTITDWTRITGSETLAIDVHAAELVRPHTLLINGIGRYDGRYMPMTDKKQKKMPVPVFNVQKVWDQLSFCDMPWKERKSIFFFF